MQQTCEYCSTQKIPFPTYTLQGEEDHLKECYFMKDSEDPHAPIIVFFPLICDTFQKYKAPGKPPTIIITWHSPEQPGAESF